MLVASSFQIYRHRLSLPRYPEYFKELWARVKRKGEREKHEEVFLILILLPSCLFSVVRSLFMWFFQRLVVVLQWFDMSSIGSNTGSSGSSKEEDFPMTTSSWERTIKHEREYFFDAKSILYTICLKPTPLGKD